MKKLLITTLLFLLNHLIAQITFDNRHDIVNRDYVSLNLIYDDFDLDGDIDIIKNGEYSPRYVILQTNENGDFNAKALNLITSDIEVVTSFDVNNDNYPDLITFHTNESLGVLYNLHDENFGPEEILVNSLNMYSVHDPIKIDYNQDGYMDLILRSDSNIYLFLNNQAGGFEPPQYILTISGSILKIADFDSDGDYDIFVNSYGPSLKIYINENGNFTTSSTFRVDSNLNSYVVLDIDGNGFMDVLYWNYNAIWVTYFGYNNTSQVAAISNQLVTDNLPDIIYDSNSIFHLETDDTTGIHTVYLVWETTAGEKHVYKFDIQNGTFGTPQLILANFQIHQFTFYQYKFLDIDNDGNMDLTYVSFYNDMDMILVNYNLEGTNDKTICIQEAIWTDKLTPVDMDGDGIEDICAGTYKGLGYFKKSDNDTIPCDMHYLLGVISNPNTSSYFMHNAVDIDNDGIGDIINFQTFGDNIQILKNLGNDNFNFIQEIPINSHSIQLHYADIDSDGFVDIINNNFSSNPTDFRWAKNNNGIFFDNFQDLNISCSNQLKIKDLQFIDYNNDNQTDLIAINKRTVNNQYFEDVIFFENQNGQFSENILFTLDNYYSSAKIKTVDFDQDGDLDIFIYDNSDNLPYLFYKNEGQNNFYKKQIAVTNIGDMEVDDLDDDGYYEIYAYRYDPSSYQIKMFFYTTNDYLNFSRYDIDSFNVSISFTEDKGDLLLFDFNDDNYKDIFISNDYYMDYKISMYKNLTGGGSGVDIKEVNRTNTALKVFPNPFVTSVIIDGESDSYHVKLLNLNGKLLDEFTTENKQVNLSGIKAGTYLLIVEDKFLNQKWTYKIIKKDNQ